MSERLERAPEERGSEKIIPEKIVLSKVEPESSGYNKIKSRRQALFKDLGVLEYNKALKIQIQAVQTKREHLFFVEHPSVFTLGKRGGEQNLSVSKKFLSAQGIDIVKTDRGGDITWHGQGQAVLYPVINLEKHKIGVKDFVHGLEEIMILTAQDFKVTTERNRKNHGIWVGNSKIGSVGISVKKGVSMHGLALNINPDLTPFSWINPCGLHNITITSIEKELNKSCSIKSENSKCDFSMNRVKHSFIKHFSSLFNFKIVNRL